MVLSLCILSYAQPQSPADEKKVALPITGKNDALSKGNLASKKVLILHSHEANAPVFVGTDKGLSDTLQSGGISSLNQFFHSLDLRRNPGSEYRKLLVKQMRMNYSHSELDMIITMYPEALQFVLKDCKDLLPHVPILALYLPQSFEVSETDRLIIGHFPTFDFNGTIEIALKLVPGAKRVYVVSGVHEVDGRLEDQARRDLKKWERQLEFLYLSHMPFEDILATVSNVPPGSIILVLAFGQDVTGKDHTAPEVAQRLSQVAKEPTFGIFDTTLGRGITGGSLISFERIGTKAGQLVLDILGGVKTPHNILAVLDVPPVPMFDWRWLRHWNLHEDALPKGSIIINRERTVWDFRYYIMGFLAFCLAETALIVILVVQRRRRKVAEEALGERLQFEGLISNCSASFVNLPPDEVDSKINEVLRSITELFDADRCSIVLFSEDGTQLVRALEYHSAEADPADESMSREQMPWYMEQLIQGNPVMMTRVQDLPPEAEKERRFCLAKGMKSVLSIPMLSEGKTLGSCTLVSTRAERAWSKELARQFQLISEVFSNALQRKHAEEAAQESAKILRQNESDLRGLAGRLIYAQEEERRHLARELHDDLAQRLAVFAINVGKLDQQLVDPPAPVQEELREMQKDVVKISQDVHGLSRQLHPSILDDLGLIKAVESECASFSRREGIEIVFNHENIPKVIPKNISLSLYRIVQEGLRNISKHACAEHIAVFLNGADHEVLLSVQDDGIGFNWVEVQKQPGLGFSSMRERARLIHGELSIQSELEKGTVISIRVPLTQEEE
jgi:signal transduction histidine kinase